MSLIDNTSKSEKAIEKQQIVAQYDFIGKIFRGYVFPQSVNGGSFDNGLIDLLREKIKGHSVFSCIAKTPCGEIGASLLSYEEIFGKDAFFTLEKGEIFIQGVYLDARLLKQRIQEFGGRWERIAEADSQSFAVIFQRKLLQEKKVRQFYDVLKERLWSEEISLNDRENALITAKKVENMPELDNPKKPSRLLQCMLRIDIADPYTMHWGPVATYVGMGVNLCKYDSRDTSEGSVISEGACYEDAEIVFNFLQKEKQLAPSNICVSANSKSTLVAMNLIKDHAKDGLSALLKNPPLSMKNAVSQLGSIPKWIAEHWEPSLQEGLETEDGFDSLKKIDHMEAGSLTSRILLVFDKKSKETSEEKVQNLFTKFRSKVPNTECIIKNDKIDLDVKVQEIFKNKFLSPNSVLQNEERKEIEEEDGFFYVSNNGCEGGNKIVSSDGEYEII